MPKSKGKHKQKHGKVVKDSEKYESSSKHWGKLRKARTYVDSLLELNKLQTTLIHQIKKNL